MTKVTQTEAINAIKTLLVWLGEDANRSGLKKTPMRVLKRYKEICKGYQINLNSILECPAMPCDREMGMIIAPSIDFFSLCEHHLLPIIGKAHIAYVPCKKLAGIGTLIKITNAFAKKLQLQEMLNIQISDAINEYLNPKGVAIAIEAKHYCVDPAENNNVAANFLTSHFSGIFKKNTELQNQFIHAFKSS